VVFNDSVNLGLHGVQQWRSRQKDLSGQAGKLTLRQVRAEVTGAIPPHYATGGKKD
jgi:hypothetical protein